MTIRLKKVIQLLNSSVLHYPRYFPFFLSVETVSNDQRSEKALW